MRKYSIIIPTMWVPEFFPEFLDKLDACERVEEIIIISNKKRREPKDKTWKKVTILSQRTNIGVNPSWNLGVDKATMDDVVIANDDIVFDFSFFDRVDEVLKLDDKASIVGLNVYGTQTEKLDGHYTNMYSLFYIKKKDYVKIPESLKIFFGDNWLSQNCLNNKKNIYRAYTEINGLLSMTSKEWKGVMVEEEVIYEEEIRKQTYNTP